MITRNLIKFSWPCSHFGIIFEQEEGKRGTPLYQTWHIVNSITLYHFTSHSISELHPYTYSFTPYIYIRQLFWPRFSVWLSPFQCFIPISVFYPHFSVLSSFQCFGFIPISVFYSHFSFRFQFPFQPFSFSVLSRPLFHLLQTNVIAR